MDCIKCGAELPPGAAFFPACGYEYKPGKKTKI